MGNKPSPILSADGFEYFFIDAPNAKPGPEPALLLLHDSGKDENQLIEIAEELAADGTHNIFAIRGPFKTADGYSFLPEGKEGGADSKVFMERAGWLSRLIQNLAAQYSLESARLICFGVGDGATLAMTLLYVHSEYLGGAILVRPNSLFRPQPLPALPCYPIMVATGHQEQPEIRQQADSLEDTLFQCGCTIKRLRVHLDQRFSAEMVRGARKWFKKVAETDLALMCAI